MSLDRVAILAGPGRKAARSIHVAPTRLLVTAIEVRCWPIWQLDRGSFVVGATVGSKVVVTLLFAFPFHFIH
jgi:hypothetical protein